MTGLRILLCTRRERARQALTRALESAPQGVEIEVVESEQELEVAIERERFDALVFELGPEARADLERLEALPDPRPALILLGSGEDPALLVRAMRLRPEAFLVDGRLDELSGALERIARSRPPANDTRGVIAVSGAKGGVGATLLACELAGWLSRSGGRTCLVDLDLHRGDVALYLDLCPLHTVADVARKGEALDAEFLRSVATEHECGVFVLAAPHELEEAGAFGTGALERTIALLRKEFAWVVLDVPGAWDPVALRALDLADLALLLCSLDVASLTHASAGRKLLLRLGAPDERVRVVLRRNGSPLTAADVTRALGRAPDLELPCDAEVAQAACNRGVPVHQLAPGGELDRATLALARGVHAWLGLPPPELPRALPSGGFASRLIHLRQSFRGLRHAPAR